MANGRDPQTIPELVRYAAERFAGREAVVDEDERFDFSALGVRVNEAARASISAGLTAGDRVAIWAPNCWEWIVAALGVVSAGCVLVPINTRFKGREAGYVIQRSGARMLFTVRGFLGFDYPEMLHEAHGPVSNGRPVEELESLERIVLLRGEPIRGTEPFAAFMHDAEHATDEELAFRVNALAPGDLSDIIFTSGTTGKPKGVMTTHEQTMRVFQFWSRAVGLEEGDRYLIVNPFFHTFGYKAGILACLMRGATIVPHAVFDAPSVLAKIASEKVTALPGPPTLYQSILNDPDRGSVDLSSLRLAVTGAAVVPVALIEAMRSDLGFETVLTAYGLTESTGTATMCRPNDDAETIAYTSGCAIPDTEVRIADDAGNEMPRGEPGEVVIRGYNVMKGYFEDPEQTAETIDPDGWLHTGDVGVMDEKGYIRITDRKKDMFIVGGFNAYPAEIEGELIRHPSIAQAAVVGASDPRLGEVGVAFVVPRAGETVDPEAVIAWAREEMANYKVPRRIEVVESLPVNASGKVLKFELREQAAKLLSGA
ncbi:MAG TPA: FadD3 family acyl-CoA ligase [Actinomycetota bacterium]|nr:FadD3 family acyl-CoA ligase [Actinomycetota bacterium]